MDDEKPIYIDFRELKGTHFKFREPERDAWARNLILGNFLTQDPELPKRVLDEIKQKARAIKNLHIGLSYLENGLTEKGRLYMAFATEDWVNNYVFR